MRYSSCRAIVRVTRWVRVCLSLSCDTSTLRCSEIRSACNQIVCIIAAYCNDKNAVTEDEDAAIPVFAEQHSRCMPCCVVYEDRLISVLFVQTELIRYASLHLI
jgi:hypothetical protein